jgi:hypothetical protein
VPEVAKRKRTGPSATTIIGGAMVDLEHRLFRSVARVEILVERGKDQTGLAGDGSSLTVGIPDAPVVVPATEEPRPR